jgi:putative two-component system response regulator
MSDPNAEPQYILIVEDDARMRRKLGDALTAAGYDCTLAADARRGLALMADARFALLLCDVDLPHGAGLHLTQHVLAEWPHTAAVMMSGSAEPELAATALDCGAYGYLLKPFTHTALLTSVLNALLRRDLELRDEAQTVRLDSSREETISRLSLAMQYRDPGTGRHLERMSHYCGLIAGELALDTRAIRIASSMHDIGKIGVPESIMLKPGPLTACERLVMQGHAQLGHDLLCDSESELMRRAAVIAWTHHERYDGGGYPRGLAGTEIPIEGRIAAVADVFDALTSTRPYRLALPFGDALTLLSAERGRHFDPLVLDAFLDAMENVDGARRFARGAALASVAGSG